jgi:hypothetical protein
LSCFGVARIALGIPTFGVINATVCRSDLPSIIVDVNVDDFENRIGAVVICLYGRVGIVIIFIASSTGFLSLSSFLSDLSLLSGVSSYSSLFNFRSLS